MIVLMPTRLYDDGNDHVMASDVSSSDDTSDLSDYSKNDDDYDKDNHDSNGNESEI